MDLLPGQGTMGKQQARLNVLLLQRWVLLKDLFSSIPGCEHPQDVFYGYSHVPDNWLPPKDLRPDRYAIQ